MEGNLEQSQSIFGAQSEGDKPTASMKKQQQILNTQYLNEKLAGNNNSSASSKSTPKKKKGRSELLGKSPVTPPDARMSFMTKKERKERKRQKNN